MIKAVGLVRVSSEEQAREGISLEAQAAKVRAYAQLNDFELVDVVVEAGRSGKTVDRPGLKEVLSLVSSGAVQAVIVVKLDRLSRRVVDTLAVIEAIEKAGAGFHSINEKVDTKSAAGRFFLTITAAFAQMERDMIAERTAECLRHKQAQGEHVGRIPFGYRLQDGRLVANEYATTIQEIKMMRADGWTLRAIAEELERRAIPTPQGGRWNLQTISNIANRTPA